MGESDSLFTQVIRIQFPACVALRSLFLCWLSGKGPSWLLEASAFLAWGRFILSQERQVVLLTFLPSW